MLMGEQKTKETVCIYLLSLSLSVHFYSSGLFARHFLKTFCFLALGKRLRVFICPYFGFLCECVDLYNRYKKQICSVQPLMISMKTRGNLLGSRVISDYNSRPGKRRFSSQYRGVRITACVLMDLLNHSEILYIFSALPRAPSSCHYFLIASGPCMKLQYLSEHKQGTAVVNYEKSGFRL